MRRIFIGHITIWVSFVLICEPCSACIWGAFCKYIFPIKEISLKEEKKTIKIMSIFKFYLFFNWRVIALQNFVVFYQTSTWINHRYNYSHSLLNLPPISLPISPIPPHWYTALVWVSWDIQQIPLGHLFYIW